jgi:hypothetical protein
MEQVGADPPGRLPQDLDGAAVDEPVPPQAPARERRVGGRGTRRSSRMAALRWMAVTGMISSNSRPFSARLALAYRSRCTAAYSRQTRSRHGLLPGHGMGNRDF